MGKEEKIKELRDKYFTVLRGLIQLLKAFEYEERVKLLSGTIFILVTYSGLKAFDLIAILEMYSHMVKTDALNVMIKAYREKLMEEMTKAKKEGYIT